MLKMFEVINYPRKISGEIKIGVEDNLAQWNNQYFY